MLEKLLRGRLGKLKYQNFWYKLYCLSLQGMNIGDGGSSHGFESNGERYVMEYVRKHVITTQSPVIFDIGANVGNYTKELLKIFPQAQIHSFEPARETYRKLQSRISSEEGNVILNNYGMSDVCTKSTLYYDKEESGLASLYNRQLDYVNIDFSKSEEVLLGTIDSYCKEKGIDAVDFVKMDIEGNELKALNGAKELICAGKIHAMQIEFGGCDLDSRTFFRDFWNLLHDKYKVYRVVKDGIYEIGKYEEQLEIFTCTNFFFEKRAV